MTSDTPQRSCALCQGPGPLRESHLIPKFVTRFLKNTSPTGRFRGEENPNQRVQDGATVRLLCDGCEQRFSSWEKPFAERVFVPHADRGEDYVAYAEWMLPLAVSLAWRTAAVQVDRGGLAPRAGDVVRARVAAWREYLLGRAALQPGEAHHALLAPTLLGLAREAGCGEHLASYALRATDSGVFAFTFSAGGRVLHEPIVVFTKLACIAFVSFLDSPGTACFENTEIAERGGLDAARQRIPDPIVRGVLTTCVRSGLTRVDAMKARVSPRQVEAGLEALRRDLASGNPSEATRAFLLDARLRALRTRQPPAG